MAGLNLNKESCSEIIDKNEKFRKIFDILFHETKYFTREEITDSLEYLIQKWLLERDPVKLYVILKNDKIGSEHYFYYHFRHLLPEHTVIHKYLKEVNEDIEMLYMDDWVLSGQHMKSTIETFLEDDDYREQMYQKILELQSKAIRGLTIIDQDAFEELLTFSENVHKNRKYLISNYSVKISTIVSIYTKESENLFQKIIDYYSKHSGLKLISKFYGDLCIKRLDYYLEKEGIDEDLEYEFYLTFNPESKNSAYPVHLDYKIANQFGSFPEIYSKCRELEPEGSLKPSKREEVVSHFR